MGAAEGRDKCGNLKEGRTKAKVSVFAEAAGYSVIRAACCSDGQLSLTLQSS